MISHTRQSKFLTFNRYKTFRTQLVKEFKVFSNKITWTHLMELSTKITSLYYNGDEQSKFLGDETFERLINILENKGPKYLHELLKEK